MTLLTHALHRAPSASSETWSGGCSFLFDRAASRRDCLPNASAIINYDIAREDAVKFRHLRAAHGCALLRDALSGACGKSGHVSRTVSLFYSYGYGFRLLGYSLGRAVVSNALIKKNRL